MRRRVRRLAQQDAFARITPKEECSLLFRTFLFRSPHLMANIPPPVLAAQVRRLAQQDAFARTTLKEECFLLFALSFFAVPALWRISLPIFHKASNACPVLFAVAEEEYSNEPLRRKLIAYFSIK